MADLPKRSDDIYKEIESFEDYELTQCVAYEMAVRNSKNLKAIDSVVSFYEENIDDFNYGSDKALTYIEEKIDKLSFMITDLEIIPYIASNFYPLKSLGYYFVDEDYFVDNLSYYKDIDRINLSIYEIIDDVLSAGLDEYKKGILNEDIKISYEVSDEWVSLNKTDFRNGYIVKTSINDKLENATIEEGIGEEGIIYKPVETVEDFKNYMNDVDGTDIYTKSIIHSDFKRPKLKIFSTFSSISPKFEIDINKPLDEIIAYITHVKHDLGKNNILKAPIELIGEELQKADDISKMCAENRNGTLKCFDGRKGLTRTQKLADMFFIYDMVKAGKKKPKILAVLDEHYDPEDKKKTSFHSDTYDKYLLVAKNYIDNLRYKELVTGVKP